MKCPCCKAGTIYVYVPIIFKWRVAEDGNIIETEELSDRAEMFEDQAQCDNCCQEFKIHEGKVLLPE